MELKQGKYDPSTHFRTEQRERFADRGPQKRRPQCEGGESQVVFGDDPHDGYASQMTRVHSLGSTAASTEGLFGVPGTAVSRTLRGAGVGALLNSNPKWPRPCRSDVLTGGPIREPSYLQGEEPGYYPKSSGNRCFIHPGLDPQRRNPVLGVYQQEFKGPLDKTQDIIARENGRAPPLRSLGSVRPMEQ